MTMNRRTIVFGALAAVAIVALWYFLVFSPKNNQISDEKDNLAEAERQGQTLEAELRQLQDLANRSPEIEAQLGKLSAAIPEQPNQADLISGLNDIADESGITWQSVTMQEPQPGTAQAPPTIPVQIQIEGGFFQALDYVNRLEHLERLVVIDGVTMNSGSGGSGGTGTESGGGTGNGLTTSDSGELSVSLTARVFSQTTLDDAGTAPGGTTSTSAPTTGTTAPTATTNASQAAN
jgi:type IV pilus assembly protein PilO